MREILFRAVSKKGDWIYGFYYCHKGLDEHFILPIVETPFYNGIPIIPKAISDYEVYKETVSEFTGLTDKNGTKIFEGDIVKGCSKSYKKNYLCEVYFNENMCHYGLTINRGSYTKHQTHDWLELTKTKASKLEVIGNIYDNPELLEK